MSAADPGCIKPSWCAVPVYAPHVRCNRAGESADDAIVQVRHANASQTEPEAWERPDGRPSSHIGESTEAPIPSGNLLSVCPACLGTSVDYVLSFVASQLASTCSIQGTLLPDYGSLCRLTCPRNKALV